VNLDLQSYLTISPSSMHHTGDGNRTHRAQLPAAPAADQDQVITLASKQACRQEADMCSLRAKHTWDAL
jgi:hypothetical protein